MTHKFTPQQVENIREAIKMWETVPSENVSYNLEAWRSRHEDPVDAPTCGTVACFGGWCAWWPAFRAQGVYVGQLGAPFIGDLVAVTQLFNDPSMFVMRGQHGFDECESLGATDHAIVMNRLKKLLARATA